MKSKYNNKKGFTLIELLAVIVILGVIITISLINIFGVTEKAKRAAFGDEMKQLYKAGMEAYLSSDLTGVFDNSNPLNITIQDGMTYSVAVNAEGNIVCIEAQNRDYIYTWRGTNSEFLHNSDEVGHDEDIYSIKDPEVADYVIDCSGIGDFDSKTPGYLASGNGWWDSSVPKTAIDTIVFTNSFKSQEGDLSFNSDEEDVGGIVTYIRGTVAYVVNNRYKRSKNAIKIKDGQDAFSGFENLKTIKGSNLLNFSETTNINNLFKDDIKLTLIEGINKWDLSNIETANYAFANTSLKDFNLSGIKVKKLQSAEGMFMNTQAQNINLSGWKTNSIKNFKDMFSKNNKLRNINLNGWETDGYQTYGNMFGECPQLETIVISSDFAAYKSTGVDMFAGDNSIKGCVGTSYIGASSTYARVDTEEAPGYFTDDNSDGILTAKLYDTSTQTGNLTVLSASGVEATPWNVYTGARLLEVQVAYMKSDTTKSLDIIVPPGMYILNGTWTGKGNGIADVSFTKLANQNTGSYVNNQTGTLHYEIEPGIENIKVTCLVMFDMALWDKNKDNGKVTASDAIIVNYNNGYSVKKVSQFKSAVPIAPGNSGQYGYSYYTYTNSGSQSTGIVYLDRENNLLQSNALLAIDQSKNPMFYRDVHIEVYGLINNDPNKPVTITKVTKGTCGSTTTLGQKYSSTNPLKIDYSNCYSSSDMSFPKATFKVSSSDAVAGDKLNVHYKIVLTSVAGSKTEFNRDFTFNIKSSSANFADLIASGAGHTVPTSSYYENSKFVDAIGAFTLSNQGYANFNNVELDYLYDAPTTSGKPKLKVYAARTHGESGQTVTAKVKLINDDGQTKGPYNFSVTSSGTANGFYFSAAEVASKNSLAGSWYIKEISYTLPLISGMEGTGSNATNFLYCSQCTLSPTSGGTYFGKVDSASSSKMTVKVGSNSKSASVNSTPTSSILYSGTISTIETPSGTNIPAGNDFEVDVYVSSVNYPYTVTQVFKNPELYLVLPWGIDIKDVLIGDKSSKISESDAIVTLIKTENINDTLSNVYKISFKTPVWFGYYYVYSSNVSSSGTDGKWIKIKFSTKEEIEDTSINLRDNIYFKEKDGNISIGGAYGNHTTNDKYDVDGDNDRSEQFGVIAETNKVVNIKG